MTPPTKNFLGIPVQGEIMEADKRVPQRPLEEFGPILQAVLDDPLIVELGWRQYTPYFNDGDPCIFSATDIWVRTVNEVKKLPEDGLYYVGDDKDDYSGMYDLDLDSTHPTFGDRSYTGGEMIRRTVSPEAQASRPKLDALNSAVAGGAFDDVLMEAFGDHAMVKIAKDESGQWQIEVDEYSHD